MNDFSFCGALTQLLINWCLVHFHNHIWGFVHLYNITLTGNYANYNDIQNSTLLTLTFNILCNGYRTEWSVHDWRANGEVVQLRTSNLKLLKLDTCNWITTWSHADDAKKIGTCRTNQNHIVINMITNEMFIKITLKLTSYYILTDLQCNPYKMSLSYKCQLFLSQMNETVILLITGSYTFTWRVIGLFIFSMKHHLSFFGGDSLFPQGCSSEILENTPKRYQNLILYPWLQIHLHPWEIPILISCQWYGCFQAKKWEAKVIFVTNTVRAFVILSDWWP